MRRRHHLAALQIEIHILWLKLDLLPAATGPEQNVIMSESALLLLLHLFPLSLLL